MGSVLTLEDFNTLLGLYGGSATEYLIDSSVFDGEGKYDFLDVTVSGSNYIVQVVNSLFTGVYSIVTGSTVSFDDDTFTFPVSQETSIKLFLGLNAGSNLEFTKYVARPCYTPYVCSMVVYDSEGELVTDTPVSIGDYTGVTDSDGEVSITIPGNRADLYQLIVSVDGTATDVLELLRTKVYLNPVCTTNTLYKESSSTLSFNVGNISHSVACQCVVNGYTYTGSSNSSTGVVSFNVNLTDVTGDNVGYSLKVLGDDWVYEANITGTVECEYYAVDSWSALTNAYSNGVGAVKITDDIVPTSYLTISRNFKVIGNENTSISSEVHSGFWVNGGVLELTDVNSEGTGYYFVLVDDGKLVLNNCNFHDNSKSLFGTYQRCILECNNSVFINCTDAIVNRGTANFNNSTFTNCSYSTIRSIDTVYLNNCNFVSCASKVIVVDEGSLTCNNSTFTDCGSPVIEKYSWTTVNGCPQ